MHDHWPITGRGVELQLISDALRRKPPAGVLISGGAGVGKTRLLTESLTMATGWQPVRVCGSATGRAVPLGALCRWAGSRRGGTAQTVERVIAAMTSDRPAPMLLGIDDAHLLDDLSALVVHQLLMRGLSAVVMSVRTGEPAPDAITSPWKDGLVRHIRLGPLARREADDLLAAALGGVVSGECATLMFERTRGNPAFLRALVEADRAESRLAQRDGQWRYVGRPTMPAALQDLILVQMGPMSRSVTDVVELVAAARSLNRHCLDHLADADAIEHAAGRGLIVAPAAAPDDVRLGHPLHAEALLARCGPLRIRRLNGRVAQALRSCRDAASVDPVHLGSLWLGSDLPPDLDVFSAAAKAAADRLDVCAAERFARAAVAAGGGHTAQIVHARTLHFLGQGTDAHTVLESLDADTVPLDGIADEVILRASNLLWMRHDIDSAGLVVETAMRYATGRELHKLRAFEAMRLTLCATPHDVLRLIETIDHSRLDQEGRIFAAFGETLALANLGRTRQAIAASARNAPIHPLSVAETILAMTLADQTVSALTTAGYLTEADTAATEFAGRFAGLSGIGRAASSAVTGLVALRHGDLSAARENLADAIGTAEGYLKNSVVAYRNLIRYAEAQARGGDAKAAVATRVSARAVQLDAHAETEITWQLGQAWVHAAERKTGPARKAALRAAAAARKAGRLAEEVYCLQTAAQLSESATVERLAELARLVEDPRCAAAAHYAEALAADDPGRLVRASERFEAMGDRLAAADAAGQAAVAFRAAGLQGDALSASGRAMRIAHECGAVSPAVIAARVVLPLTRREREVAVLVARGLSNQDVADRLSLSVRTVEGHIYLASHKAGVSTRAGLARIVGQFGSDGTC